MSAQKISSALDRAKNICIVEETVEIGGSRLVVRNLRPSEYEAIIKAIAGYTAEAEYLNAWQKAYVCYALVEVNGVDFRGVDFVEVEETGTNGQTKTIKLELPSYLRDHLVSTWSKEAVYTVYRKVGDAISRAETESSNNIRFLVPEESPEEKYRSLLGELKEIEDEVPPALVDSILEETGLMRKSTADQIKAALEKDSADGWEEVQRKKREAAPPPPPPEPVEPCDESIADPMQKGVRIACEQPRGHEGDHLGRGLTWERQVPKATSAPLPTPPIVTPTDFATRQPLNQRVVDIPTLPPVQREAVPAMRAMSKAERFAALEASADQIGAISTEELGMEMPREVPELAHKQDRINPKDAMGILDKPPTVGLNPKFRPQR